MSQIIQFAHSGQEWGADHVPRHPKQYIPVDGNPGWFQRGETLRGVHGRKFVEGSGKYVKKDEAATPADPLYFWCEAEWDTMARPLVMPPNAGTGVYPQWLHKFYSKLPECPKKGTNTDPYIFGKQFIYSNCKQTTSLKRTEISPGDLILFGSVKRVGCKTPQFMLDTVFVVSEFSCPIAKKSIKEIRKECGDRISDSFVETVLEQLKEIGCGHNNDNGSGCGAMGEYTLYFGASYNKPWNGMYSFVPVKVPGLNKTAQQQDYGYERLTFTTLPLALDGMLNLNLAQGVRIVQKDNSKIIWEEIVNFAFHQGYYLGTYFKEP